MNSNHSQLKLIDKKLPLVTIRNSLISILLAIFVMGFNFARTALTSDIFGVDSLGLLTIILAILPYISSGHNSLISVSSAKLYDPIYNQDYQTTNNEISKLKPQYYMFGSFYLILTIILAFILPFIANKNGVIILDDNHTNQIESIQWYEASSFVLSNAIELIATYFIIPISIILLYINKKSYIYNLINILLTIVFNVVIIVLFVLIKNHTINISFININIIIFCILGFKSILLLFILFPIRKKIFPWYKFQWLKIKDWRISKASWQSMLSGYFNQFSTDIIAIIFLIYSSLSSLNHEIIMRHGVHGTGEIESNFIPSSIYTIFLMILSSINEIVHCIIDEAIPSVAEHTTFNNHKIKRHFFHRYQMLSLFIAIFTSTSYLFISGFLQSIFLDSHDTHFMNNNILNMLVFLLWIPTFVDIFSSMYIHLLSIIKKFNKILIISSIKAIINLIILTIMCTITFKCIATQYWIYYIYASFIISNLIANITCYCLARFYAKIIINHDECVNVYKTTMLSFIYLLIVIGIMLSINLTQFNNIIHILDKNQKYVIILCCIGVIIINFIINLINIYLCRHDDTKFYLDELRCQLFCCKAHKLSHL